MDKLVHLEHDGVDFGDAPVALELHLGERVLKKRGTEPRAQRTAFPADPFVPRRVEHLTVKRVSAENQRLLFLHVQDDPFDGFCTVLRDVILLVTAEQNRPADSGKG